MLRVFATTDFELARSYATVCVGKVAIAEVVLGVSLVDMMPSKRPGQIDAGSAAILKILIFTKTVASLSLKLALKVRGDSSVVEVSDLHTPNRLAIFLRERANCRCMTAALELLGHHLGWRG